MQTFPCVSILDVCSKTAKQKKDTPDHNAEADIVSLPVTDTPGKNRERSTPPSMDKRFNFGQEFHFQNFNVLQHVL